MSIQLLDKTRKIQKLIKNSSSNIDFNDVCGLLCETLNCDALILDNTNRVIAKLDPQFNTFKSIELNSSFDQGRDLLDTRTTRENISCQDLGIEAELTMMLSPVLFSNTRYGCIIVSRSLAFNVDDIILIEYIASILAMEFNHRSILSNDMLSRDLSDVKAAVNSLSKSELVATSCILSSLVDGQGMVVVSKISESCNITRSIIVNAIKKLDSAGVIEAKSHGSKGTSIRVLNDLIYKEV